MELREAMRTMGACRRFKPDPVPDEVLYDAFEVARFAPQGGNRQPVRWVVVRDAAVRRQLGEWYLPLWHEYLRAQGVSTAREEMAPGRRTVDDFARSFGEVPAILVAVVQLDLLFVNDTELGRQSIIGGASVYPMVQNVCLALRDAGVGTALTTMLVPREADVKRLLGVPEELAVAALVAAGYPERPFPTRLRRAPVEELAFAETYGTPLRR